MNRTYIIAGLTTLALVGTASLAMACGDKGHGGRGGPHGGPQINFEEVDANSDGQLSQEEMAAHHKAKFDKADTDGNGALSQAEMKAQMEARMQERAQKRAERGDKMMARMIERHDANGDGELGFDEMKGDREAKMFARMDADKSGTISAEELEQMGAHGRKGHGPRNGEKRHGCDRDEHKHDN